MKMEPKRGQIYQFTDHDSETAKLVLTTVTEKWVEYKFLNDDGTPGRYTYPMVIELWNTRPDGMQKIGEMELIAGD